jgi:hypothetical protein
MLSSVRNIYNSIFTVFPRLITLILLESTYSNCVRLSFHDSPIPCRFSTIRELNIKVHSFGDCLELLDGRFDQLHTFIVDLVHIRSPRETKNQVSFIRKISMLLDKKTFLFFRVIYQL